MIVVPLIKSHIEGFNAQEEQREAFKLYDNKFIDYICANESYSIIHNGNVVVMAGIFNINDKDFAWVILSDIANNKMLEITRIIKKFMQSNDKDLYMFVREGFEAGERWAKLLGFTAINSSNGNVLYERLK